MNTDLDKTKDKDAELARWREQALQEDATANALRDQVASLSSLVKELADDLSGYLCDSECNGSCESFGHCCNQTSRKIVAKAREVVSKMETTAEVAK